MSPCDRPCNYGWVCWPELISHLFQGDWHNILRLEIFRSTAGIKNCARNPYMHLSLFSLYSIILSYRWKFILYMFFYEIIWVQLMQFSIIVYIYLTYYNKITLTNFGNLSLCWVLLPLVEKRISSNQPTHISHTKFLIKCCQMPSYTVGESPPKTDLWD